MFVQCFGNRKRSLRVAAVPWAPWDPDKENGSWYLKTTSSLLLPPPVYIPWAGSSQRWGASCAALSPADAGHLWPWPVDGHQPGDTVCCLQPRRWLEAPSSGAALQPWAFAAVPSDPTVCQALRVAWQGSHFPKHISGRSRIWSTRNKKAHSPKPPFSPLSKSLVLFLNLYGRQPNWLSQSAGWPPEVKMRFCPLPHSPSSPPDFFSPSLSDSFMY